MYIYSIKKNIKTQTTKSLIMKTTLNKIKEQSPCEEGWIKLLTFLNKIKADDEPLELKTILESNGTFDTIWALRTVESYDKEIRLLAADLAESVLHIFEEKFPKELDAAWADAGDAATGADAWADAGAATRAVRDAATGSAARAAKEDTAMDPELKKQKQILLKYI
jgi:hypothetical protein